MLLDPAPPVAPLSERDLERSLRLNIGAGAVGMFWSAVALGMPLPLFMEAIHATGRQLGTLGALRQLSMIGQVPAAFIVERMAARKPLWALVVTIHRGMWIIPALLPLLLPGQRALYPVITIVALGVSDLLSNVGYAPWISWMADLVPGSRSGRFWGTRQRLLSSSLILASGIFGIVLDHFPGRDGLTGFTIVFAVGACAGMADIAIHWRVHEPRPLPHPRTEHFLTRVVAPLRDRAFRRLTLALGAWSCAIAMPGYNNGLPGFFNFVYLKEEFHATYSQASLLLIASAVGAILWTRRIGHLMDVHGARRVIVFLMRFGSTTTLAAFFVSPVQVRFFVPILGPQSFPQPVLLMSAAGLIIGGFYAGVLICQVRLTALHTPAEGRTVPMAVHWSLVGIMASLGPLAAGYIKDHFPAGWSAIHLPFGAPFSYFQVIILLQAALIWLVAVPLLRRES